MRRRPRNPSRVSAPCRDTWTTASSPRCPAVRGCGSRRRRSRISPLRYRPLLTFVSVYSEGVPMAQRLLAGLRVVDLGAEPSARAARVLGDLGASVVRVVPPGGDVLRAGIARAWNAGKHVVELAADDPQVDELLTAAEVVFDSPGAAGPHQ